MTNYESKVTVMQPSDKVYEQVSDMRNLEKYKDKIGQNGNVDVQFSQDSITANVSQFGQVTLRLAAKEANKNLKFVLENLPITANLYLKLNEIAAEKTEINFVLEADIPFFLRPMLGNKIDTALNKISEIFAAALNG